MSPDGQEETLPAGLAPTFQANLTISAGSQELGLGRGDVVGRYMILSLLGRGGMGIVFAAYDPELNRKVAIKLLLDNTSKEARARTLREAQVLASLSHPNVVSIYDVGLWREYVWLAMELVDGYTLRSWLEQEPRPWRTILEVFRAAGEGLMEAHRVGLVHRDFKPENVMLGKNSRVYVMDFGLARVRDTASACAADDDELVHAASSRLDPALTAQGVIQGTPAYMAPEQWRGEETDARTDQFSFCVCLYEALYGTRPYPGPDSISLMARVTQGVLPPLPANSRVPRRLHRILVRGLATAPGQRWAGIQELLHALEQDPERTRRRIIASIGLLGAVAAVSYSLAVANRTDDNSCSGGATQITEVWGTAHRDAASRAFAAAGPAFADEIWPRVTGTLDRYANDWQTSHREACQAHRRGETSGTLLDRRMACLEQRKAGLAQAVDVLATTDPEIALHALEVVAHLPDLARCDDLTALDADADPPSDLHVRTTVAAQRPLLDRVRVLEHAGLSTAAQSLADDVVKVAVDIGDRTFLAEALLARGRLEINRLDNRADQDTLLTRAYLTALGGRLDELATEALALRMYIRSRAPGNAALALDDLAVAEEMIARLPSQGPVHGLVLNNAGVVYMANGDPTRAAKLFREALTVRETVHGPDHVEVAFTLANLAMVSPPDERMPLLQRALAILDYALGQAHPQTIEMRIATSFYALDPREAQTLLAPACAALGRFSPSDQAQRARCLAFLGHHASEAGETKAAAAAFAEVESVLPADTRGLQVPPTDIAQMRGRAALYSGNHRAAIEVLRDTLTRVHGDEWWQRRHRAEVQLLLGLHLDLVGDREDAGNALTAAVREFAEVASGSPDVLLLQRLAGARVALAKHLLSGHPPPEQRRQAITLLHDANEWYRGAGESYAWRLTELDTLSYRATVE